MRARCSPALLAMALASVAPAGAWPVDAPAPPPPSTPSTPSPPAAPEGMSWLDASHLFVARGLLWPVIRFDRFFSDEREVDLPRTSSFIRLRNTVTLRDDGRRAYAPDLRADVVLPNLDRRLEQLRLTVAAGHAVPLDPAGAPEALSPDALDRPHVGLRYSPMGTLLALPDFQIGVLFQRPLGVFGRARIRYVQPLANVLVARLALSGFWQSDTGWGTRQDVSLEHPFTYWLMLRLTSTGLVTQRSRGWEWSSELGLLAASWPRSALSLSAAALGATQAGPSVEVWRVQLRARHDVFRRWVFAEVNPEVVWTRLAGGRRVRTSAVMLVLEVQFAASTDMPIDLELEPGR